MNQNLRAFSFLFFDQSKVVCVHKKYKLQSICLPSSCNKDAIINYPLDSSTAMLCAACELGTTWPSYKARLESRNALAEDVVTAPASLDSSSSGEEE